jgi:hypothetical protein
MAGAARRGSRCPWGSCRTGSAASGTGRGCRWRRPFAAGPAAPLRALGGLHHGLVLGAVLVGLEQDAVELLAHRGGQRRPPVRRPIPRSARPAGPCARWPAGGLDDLSGRLLELALAGAAEVVRRLEQAEQRGGLLLGPGLGREVVARQVGKAELALGANSQARSRSISAACAWAAAISSAGWACRSAAARWPPSPSRACRNRARLCTEASASDITRPARNLPASSNRAYIGRIVAALVVRGHPRGHLARLGRLGRRAEAVQVEQMGYRCCVHGLMFTCSWDCLQGRPLLASQASC